MFISILDHCVAIEYIVHSFSINRCIRVIGDLFTWYASRKYKLCSKQSMLMYVT